MLVFVLPINCCRIICKLDSLEPLQSRTFSAHAQDFGYEDDVVMAQLQGTMEDLRRSKLDLPPKAKQNETPAMPFGLFTEPAATPVPPTTTKIDEKEV